MRSVTNLSDPYADPRFHSAIDIQTGYRTRNLLTLPMIDRGGRVIGVFQVMNTRKGRFEEEDVDNLTALAATAAMVIERARAHPRSPIRPGSFPSRQRRAAGAAGGRRRWRERVGAVARTTPVGPLRG